MNIKKLTAQVDEKYGPMLEKAKYFMNAADTAEAYQAAVNSWKEIDKQRQEELQTLLQARSDARNRAVTVAAASMTLAGQTINTGGRIYGFKKSLEYEAVLNGVATLSGTKEGFKGLTGLK